MSVGRALMGLIGNAVSDMNGNSRFGHRPCLDVLMTL